MTKKYTKTSKDEKIKAVNTHLLDKKPISDVCEIYGISPSTYYEWQKEFISQGSKYFGEKNKAHKVPPESKKVKDLEAQLDKAKTKSTQKDEALAELLMEHTALKKSLGVI